MPDPDEGEGVMRVTVRREATLASILGRTTIPGLLQVTGNDGAVVASITHDSRRVEPHSMFCCVVGATFDGHEFASAARAAGASALLVERLLPVDLPQIVVRSVREAMAPLSASVYGQPSHRLDVIGVTGTNGKTTTAHVIAEIFGHIGRPAAALGTLTGAFTTPESPDLQATLADMADSGITTVAMEVSSHALALHRVDGMRFVASVFTNLGRDHLDLHGTQEAYFAAKSRLFDEDLSQLAVLNLDDEYGRRLMSSVRIPAVPYSVSALSDVEVSATAVAYTWLEERVHVPLGGAFNVSNSLAAATTAHALGVEPDAVADALNRVGPVPGRFEHIDCGQPFTVIVDFAHTPDALGAVLASAKSVAGSGRLILVFGCGGNRDRAKRPEMGLVAAQGADLVVVTSDNPRDEDPMTIIDEVLVGVPDASRPGVVVEPDRAMAIEAACRVARPGDVVLVAGKGHERTQTIGDQIIEFDDRDVARRILGVLS